MKTSEKETTMTGGKSMPNELIRHNVPFGKADLDDRVLNFCGLLNNEPADGVKIISIHLLHGLFHLLTDQNKVWEKIQQTEINSIFDPKSLDGITANSHQQNLQPFVDSAQYIVYKIADSKNESLKKDQIVSMIRGIAGYSVFLLREWLGTAETSQHDTAALDVVVKLTLQRLTKLREMHKNSSKN